MRMHAGSHAQPEGEPGLGGAFLALWAAFTVCFVITAWCASPRVAWIQRDSGVFLCGAKAVLEGQRLYLDFWDHKPLLIFYVDALGLKFHGIWGVWFLENSVLYLAFVAVFAALRRWGTRYLVFPFFLLLLARSPRIYEGGNLTEVWVLLLWLVAFALLTRPLDRLGLALLGLVTVAAFCFKPNSFSLFAAYWGVDVVKRINERRSLKPFWVYLGWVALGGGLLVAWMVSQGMLGAGWNAVVQFNFKYIHLARYSFAASPFLATDTKWWIVFFGMLSAAGILLSTRPLIYGLGPLSGRWFWGLFALGESFSVASSGRYYGHYFMPFCLIVAYGLTALLDAAHEKFAGTRSAKAFGLMVAVLFLPLAVEHFSCLESAARTITAEKWPEEERYQCFQNYLAVHPLRDCYVWGEEAKAYFVGDLMRLGRFPYMLPLITPGYLGESEIRAEYDRVFRHPEFALIDFTPRGSPYDLSLLAAPSDPEFLRLLKKRLSSCSSIDSADGFTVYHFGGVGR